MVHVSSCLIFVCFCFVFVFFLFLSLFFTFPLYIRVFSKYLSVNYTEPGILFVHVVVLSYQTVLAECNGIDTIKETFGHKWQLNVSVFYYNSIILRCTLISI